MGTQRLSGRQNDTPGNVGRSILPLLVAFFLATIAAVPRLADLDNRTMHCDEAVHGVKFGALLEEGDYKYNPNEYHGPGLNYLTLPIAWTAGAETIVEVTEFQLRLLPALFGIALAVLAWAARKELGGPAAFFAAILTAASPAMVFYSRYYIQEMLLVFFTFSAILAFWRFAGAARADENAPVAARRAWWRRHAWPLLLGVSAGMMHAGKETCVIALFAMLLAGLVYWSELKQLGAKRIATSGLVALVAAAVVSGLFFSSFSRNPGGVADSVATYFHYAAQAAGEGDAGSHDQPWHYYLRILFWWQRDGGCVWTEMPIALLSAVGFTAALAGRWLGPANVAAARFLAVFTLVMIVVYAAIPYKTPWCALGFLHGMILLAGIGVQVLLHATRRPAAAVSIGVVLVAAVGQLGIQAHRASFVAFEDPDNPYVYAPTTGDVVDLAARVREMAATHGEGTGLHVQVLCPDDDFWPLPWYLRDMKFIEWVNKKPTGAAAPLIVIQPSMEAILAEYLYKDPKPGRRPLYSPVAASESEVGWRLRPNVRLRMYARYSWLTEYHRAIEDRRPPAAEN